MMAAIIIAVCVGAIAYVLMAIMEERTALKKRVSFVADGRLNATVSSLDKERIIARLQKEQKEQKGAKHKKNNFDALIEQSGIAKSKTQVIIASGLLGVAIFIVALLGLGNMIFACLSGLVAAILIPRIVFSILIAKREQAFMNELPNALDILSRGLRGGMPLGTCIRQIAEATSDPLKTEFAHVIDLHKLGLPLAEAIKRMPDRIDLMDLRFFTIVIEIQQRSGGNLSEIIENISGVIRGRKEMKAKIRALISEAKTSSIIIGIVPAFFSLLSFWSDPKAFSRFWTEPLGQILMIVALLFYVVGISLFMKISRVKV